MGRLVLCLALAAALTACGDDGTGGGRAGSGGDGGSGGVGGGGSGGSGGTGGGEPLAYRFVTSSLRLPASSAEARNFGFDLDGDGSVDNAIGSLVVLSGVGLSAGDPVAAGELIQLHVLETPSLAEAGEASWTVYAGEPTPSPDFSGAGSFTVAGEASGTLAGTIEAGTFRGGPAALPLSLPFGDGPVPAEFALERVALEVAVTEDGCEGKLGGAVPSGDFEGSFVPAVALALNAMIAADPGCQQVPPACGAELAAALAIFDTDGDLAITAEELLANPMFTTLVRPDVDLDDDGETDAFGIGMGFTCVPASFEIP